MNIFCGVALMMLSVCGSAIALDPAYCPPDNADGGLPVACANVNPVVRMYYRVRPTAGGFDPLFSTTAPGSIRHQNAVAALRINRSGACFLGSEDPVTLVGPNLLSLDGLGQITPGADSFLDISCFLEDGYAATTNTASAPGISGGNSCTILESGNPANALNASVETSAHSSQQFVHYMKIVQTSEGCVTTDGKPTNSATSSVAGVSTVSDTVAIPATIELMTEWDRFGAMYWNADTRYGTEDEIPYCHFYRVNDNGLQPWASPLAVSYIFFRVHVTATASGSSPAVDQLYYDYAGGTGTTNGPRTGQLFTETNRGFTLESYSSRNLILSVPIVADQSFTISVEWNTAPVGFFEETTGSRADLNADGHVSFCEYLQILEWNASISNPGTPLASIPPVGLFGIDNEPGLSPTELTAITDAVQAWSGYCAADLNCDGTLDGSDYVLFVNAFALEAPAADLTFDGTVDGSDFVVFINSYALGCP